MGKLLIALALALSINGDNEGLDQMRSIYKEQNKKWFKGELPAVEIKWMHEDSFRAMTHNIPDKGFVIEFNPKYITAETTARFVMFHEQCHVAHWADYGDGPVWLKCMKDLAARGAFDDIY